jgi:hypothetical protein
MFRFLSVFRNLSSNSNSTFFTAVKHNGGFVGRWSIPNKNTDTIINQIFDRNNEDHCGVCINDDSNLMKKNIVEEHNDDEYYQPFFM